MSKSFSRLIRRRSSKLKAVQRSRSLSIESLEERALLAATRFAVIGDYGASDPREADVAALVKGWNPDIILTAGDNNFPTGEASTIDLNVGQYYHDYIFPYLGSYGAGAATNRFFPTLGNRDWGNTFPNPTGAQPFLDYFTLPGNERYYTFTNGPVQFFALSSDPNEPDGTLPTSTQGNWLQQELLASTATYKVVYFHHPPYSSTSWSESADMRWPFQAWGATAVVTANAHNYERLIGDNNFPYFVNGLGGNDALDPYDDIEPGSQLRYNADNGALFVTADETQMQFQFITRTGVVIDSYTIPAPQPKVLTTLVPTGADWKYLDNGSNQGTAWRDTTFDDSAWSSGPAQLGYGDGDEKTVISYGGDVSNKHTTSYFRKSFVVSDPSVAADGLTLNLLRDDGAVVYLNGVEVLRNNLPSGTIGYKELASSSIFEPADESGLYSFTINPALLVAGTNVLAVEIHQSDVTSPDVSFDLGLIGTRTLVPNAATSLKLTGFPSPSEAGAAGSFTVTALDANGNTATGFRGTIRFTSSDNQAALPIDYTFTAADNGTHTFSATLKSAGNQTLVARNKDNGSVAGSQTVTVKPAVASSLHLGGFSSSTQSIQAIQPIIPVQGYATSNFTVTALDTYGNVATGYRGTVHFSSSDNDAILPDDYTFTEGDAGVHTFSVTLKTPGSQSLNVTDTANGLISDTETIPGPPVAASSLRVSGFPSPTKAGVSGNFTVKVLNADGTVAKGYRGTIQFSSSDGQADLPANYTFTAADNGVHTFSAKLKTAGSQSLKANDTANNSVGGTQTISVQAAAASSVRLSGFPSPVKAGVSGKFTVTAQDAYGNVATSYRGTVRFSSSDSRAVLPSKYTFSSGDKGVRTFSATLKTAGSQWLAATDAATSSIKGTQTITVNSAAASSLSVSEFGLLVKSGVAKSFVVTVRDAYGNIATGYRGTIRFKSSDSRAELPNNYTFTEGDSGVHTFSAKLKSIGIKSLTVSDTVNKSINDTRTVLVLWF